MLFKCERWLAPGHNSIVTDKAGQVWIVYHAIDANRPRQRQEDEINSRRILLIDRIKWRDGWPFVGTPSAEFQTGPITRAQAPPAHPRPADLRGETEQLALHFELGKQGLVDVAGAVGDNRR